MARTLSTEARAYIARWKETHPDADDAEARAEWDRENARQRQARVRQRARERAGGATAAQQPAVPQPAPAEGQAAQPVAQPATQPVTTLEPQPAGLQPAVADAAVQPPVVVEPALQQPVAPQAEPAAAMLAQPAATEAVRIPSAAANAAAGGQAQAQGGVAVTVLPPAAPAAPDMNQALQLAMLALLQRLMDQPHTHPYLYGYPQPMAPQPQIHQQAQPQAAAPAGTVAGVTRGTIAEPQDYIGGQHRAPVGWSYDFYTSVKGSPWLHKEKIRTDFFAQYGASRFRVFILRWLASLRDGAPDIPRERLDMLDAAAAAYFRVHPDEARPPGDQPMSDSLARKDERALQRKETRHGHPGSTIRNYLASNSHLLSALTRKDGRDFTLWLEVTKDSADLEARIADAVNKRPDHLRSPYASNAAMTLQLSLHPFSEEMRGLAQAGRILMGLKRVGDAAWQAYNSSGKLQGRMREAWVHWRTIKVLGERYIQGVLDKDAAGTATYADLQGAALVAINTCLPPVRNDYGRLRVLKDEQQPTEAELAEPETNFLRVRMQPDGTAKYSRLMVHYKTMGVYGNVELTCDVSDEVGNSALFNRAITAWMQRNATGFVFLKSADVPKTAAAAPLTAGVPAGRGTMRAMLAALLGRVVVSAQPAGTPPKKGLGVQVLRASLVTYLHARKKDEAEGGAGLSLEAKASLARLMLHTLGVQQRSYIKKMDEGLTLSQEEADALLEAAVDGAEEEAKQVIDLTDDDDNAPVVFDLTGEDVPEVQHVNEPAFATPDAVRAMEKRAAAEDAGDDGLELEAEGSPPSRRRTAVAPASPPAALMTAPTAAPPTTPTAAPITAPTAAPTAAPAADVEQLSTAELRALAGEKGSRPGRISAAERARLIAAAKAALAAQTPAAAPAPAPAVTVAPAARALPAATAAPALPARRRKEKGTQRAPTVPAPQRTQPARAARRRAIVEEDSDYEGEDDVGARVVRALGGLR
jgi:hypothetical protein